MGQKKNIEAVKEKIDKPAESFRQSVGFLSFEELEEARVKLAGLKDVLGDTVLWQG